MKNKALFKELLGDDLRHSGGFLFLVLLLGLLAGENVFDIGYPPVRVMGAYLALAIPIALFIAYHNRGLLIVYTAVSVPLTAADGGFSILAILYPISISIWLFGSQLIGLTVLIYTIGRTIARQTTATTAAPIEEKLVHSDWRVVVVGWVIGVAAGVLFVSSEPRLLVVGPIVEWLPIGLLVGWALFRYGGGYLAVAGLYVWPMGLLITSPGDELALLFSLSRAVGVAATSALIIVGTIVALERLFSAVERPQSEDESEDKALSQQSDVAEAGSSFDRIGETIQQPVRQMVAGATPWLVFVPVALIGPPRGGGTLLVTGYAAVVAVGMAVAVGLTVLPYTEWGWLEESDRRQFVSGAILGLIVLTAVAFGVGS